MAFLGIGAPQEQGEQVTPPVSKFNQFIDNFVNQVNQSPTAELAQTAATEIVKLSDNSPVLPSSTIQSWNSQVPGLDIPAGTRTETGQVILTNQMKRNNLKWGANNPQNNGIVAWTGKIVGGTGRFVLDPAVLFSALTGAAAGESLVGTRFLPEIPYFAKAFPELSVQMAKTGVEGGVFGLVDGLSSGEIGAAQKKVETGQDTTTGQIVRGAINESLITGIGGAALDVAARGIAKGIGLFKGGFNANPNLDEEVARRTEEATKQGIRERASQIGENQKAAALENVQKAQDSVANTKGALQDTISKFETDNPESSLTKGFSSYLDTVDKADVPLDSKIQSYQLARKPLSEFSFANNNSLGDELGEVDKHISAYNNLLAQPQANEGVDSLQGILSDFRMVTPNDYTALKKIAISQLEQGREVDVEPYLGEVVQQNARVLRDRLDDAGFNRGRVLHATLDSLDVVKKREVGLDEGIQKSRDLLKETTDKDERDFIQGTINGRTALKTVVTQQRAVHELLATAIADGFKKTSNEEITSYLQNQVSRDADFKGGYKKFAEELAGESSEERLARLEEEPAPFTPESKEEVEKLNSRKKLAPKISKEAIDCITGN